MVRSGWVMGLMIEAVSNGLNVVSGSLAMGESEPSISELFSIDANDVK